MTRIRTKVVGQGPAARAFYQCCRAIVVGFCRVWCRMSVVGREHVPRDGAFMLASVHRSILDTPILGGVSRRRLRFMGADKYWRVGWFGAVLTALGGVPVTRGTADREALKRCITVLESGEPVVLFPEGERKQGDLVHPLFDGATYIAVKAGVPIVPCAIAGSGEAMPKGARFIRPAKVVVVVGEPMEVPSGGTSKEQREAVRKLTTELHAELQRLYDDARSRR